MYSFNNPYLEEGDENKYTATVIMDEARERWRVGNWRAGKEAFDVKRSQIVGKRKKGAAPSAARFKLDVKKDLMGEGISLKKLSELNYSPAYRPRGNLDEHLVTPMSTLQRYDVLAGDLEAPPEDISFLSDADSRRRREDKAAGTVKRDGSLRRDTRRLETSLDERRSALIDMLPDRDSADTKRIIRESNERKARMDAEIGRPPKEEEPVKKKKKSRVPVGAEENDEVDLHDLSVVRSTRMPKQYGMEPSTMPLPEFQSETRYWSRITDENPSWSEVMRNTENYSPSDLEDEPESRAARYVEDVEYDPSRPFDPVAGIAPRKRLHSDRVGRFENEYLEKEGIDRDRVRDIMEKTYRGRWIPPEYYADDRLVDAWFNDFSRGALDGEDFLDWAYRQRKLQAEERRREMEYRRRAEEDERARRARPSPARLEADRREAERRRYEQARMAGYRAGAQMARDDRPPRRDSRRPASRSGYTGMYPDLFEPPRRPRPRDDYDDYDDDYRDAPRRRR